MEIEDEVRLNLIDITKKYQKLTALDKFSYEFKKGVYGFLGPNGAGKSTLMNIISLNLRQNEGKIFYDGKDVANDRNDYLKQIGYMPQQQEIYENMPLLRFMYFMSALKGIKKKDATIQIKKLLEKVELWDVRHKKMGGFSGGMKQRALIAQALLGNPRIIILDEPTAGLDPIQRINIKKLIVELGRESMVLITTHILSDIEDVANEIIIMNKGRIMKKIDMSESREYNLEKMYVEIIEGEN